DRERLRVVDLVDRCQRRNVDDGVDISLGGRAAGGGEGGGGEDRRGGGGCACDGAHGHGVGGVDGEGASRAGVDGDRVGRRVAAVAVGRRAHRPHRDRGAAGEGHRRRAEGRRAGAGGGGVHRNGERLRVADLVDRSRRRDLDAGVDVGLGGRAAG